MSFATVVDRLRKVENPYPGLRPFETEESHLFFGRDQQVAELVGRLERNRFVAVLGVSGSGKSSLVRAGLIPALERGRVSDAGQRWRMVVARPAGAPFASLGRALAQAGFDASRLVLSSHGLIETARQLAGDESLLIVIDQFEELFRYKDFERSSEAAARRRAASAAEAAEFVQLLLASGRHHPPVYIVLTMRSDYLGDCAEFRDLPETLNDCQYLVPRMTREQRKEAIQLPLGEVEIAPNLVQRLLNDAGDEPDQLPILQHALMRTWSHWQQAAPDRKRRIQLEDYEAIGGFGGALNRHADELLDGVPHEIVATIFKRLTARGSGSRERRDPAPLGELWALCGADTGERRDQVTAVVDHFRRGDATFLTPRDGALGPDTYIDITHESLIRQWRKLRDEWLPDEERSARIFLDLAGRARSWKAGRGEVLIGLDFAGALEWEGRRNKSEAWAEHYAAKADLESALDFIRASGEKERQRQFRAKRNLIVAVTLTVVFAALALVAVYKWVEADQLKRTALVRQLAAQSMALQAEGGNLEPAALLAAESVSRQFSLDGDRALRESVARLPRRVVSFEHQAPVSAVAFSPDGRWLATGSGDAKSHVFDVETGKEVSFLKHGADVTSVAFSPDGRWVATGSEDKTSRVFEAANGNEIFQLKHRGKVVSVAFSPDGRQVATASEDATVRIFDPVNRREIWQRTHDGPVASVVFSPDGRTLATASADETTRIFEAASGKPILRIQHDGRVESVAFSADGRWVATGSGDKTTRVFDARTGRELFRLPDEGPVFSVAFSGHSPRVVTGGQKGGSVFDVLTGRPVIRLPLQGSIDSVAFSADGRHVLTGSEDGTVSVIDADSGKEILRVGRHVGAVESVAFSQDGRRAASAGSDGTATIFDALQDNEIARFAQAGIRATALSGDRRRLAVGGTSEIAQLFDATKGTPTLSLSLKGSVGSVAVSADGRLLAIGTSEMAAIVFDAMTGTEISHLQHEGGVASVWFSEDGRRVVTGSYDGTARVFEAASGKQILRLQHDGPVISAIFSGDGNWIATGSEDRTARVFDAASGKEVSRLTHDGTVTWAAFSPDGRLVATGSEDGSARVFDPAKPDGSNQIASLQHKGAVRFVTFDPAGLRVVTGSDEAGARVFDAATGTEITRIALNGRVVEARFVPQGDHLLTLSFSGAGDEVVLTRHLLNARDLIAQACSRVSRNLGPNLWFQYVGAEVPYRRTCPDRP